MIPRSGNRCTGAEFRTATEAVGISGVTVFAAGGFLRVSDFGAAVVVVGVLGNGLGFGLTADRAGEGEYIINRVVKVSLPETGGPGTSMIYLLGIALIVLAGGGYILRNRRLLVTRPGSGHGRKVGDPMG